MPTLEQIKHFEKSTKHDIKACEYALQKCCDEESWPCIHLGCTSEDVTNTAWRLMLLKWCKEMGLPRPEFKMKWGGATGNMSAWKILDPDKDWEDICDGFAGFYGMEREKLTTQVHSNEDLVEFFHSLKRRLHQVTDNAVFFAAYAECFIDRLPVSRLQRDLSNSTLMRNIPQAIWHWDQAMKEQRKPSNGQ